MLNFFSRFLTNVPKSIYFLVMENSINTAELLEILKVTPPEQNIMLAGNHGIGKSQIITEYFTKKKMKVVTLFLGQMCDPGDLIGLPRYNERTGLMEFAPPYWFPTDNKPIVLFLDELNRARPEILQTIMDLALNKKLAGRPLPQGSRIVSAVNCGDEYQLTDLDPALVSRFNIYTFRPDAEDWLKWATNNNFDERLLHYIRIKPNRLDSYRLEENESSLTKTPDRRAWEKVNYILKSIPELKPLHAKILGGVVGNETALDFIATESKHERKKITGFDILEKGKAVLTLLTPFEIFEFSEIINSVFANLDALKNPSETKRTKVVKNLTDFVKWLNEKKKYEPLAYFTSLFMESEYYYAKEFIQKYCKEVIELISDFIKDYGQSQKTNGAN